MEWVTFVLVLALFGLVIGGLARLVLPGPEAIGVLGTILAGIAGAILGGIVGRVLFGDTNWLASLLLAVGGAILFLLPFRVPRRAVR
ncbi:MAG: GlsB/YeaQ/YmgE family stress response membrane protein [Acidimicrobiales bacterium]